MVLLGAATGVVLVHLNRAWMGPGADGPAGETSDRDRRSGFSDTEPRQRPPPPYPPPPSPPPAPPALPIEDREHPAHNEQYGNGYSDGEWNKEMLERVVLGDETPNVIKAGNDGKTKMVHDHDIIRKLITVRAHA